MSDKKSMKLKIKLMNIQNPNTFMEIVDKCKGKVELVGPDLRLNLKSKMSQLLSLAKLFDADVDLGTFKIAIYDPDDVLLIINYLRGGH